MPKVLKSLKAPKQNGPLTAKLLGQFVKAKRTQAGLKLEDAALLCNIAKDTLSKIENAREGVRFENILHVCKMLGIELVVKPWNEN
jgi:transcriptional regulator with XRE-family HTH domain